MKLKDNKFILLIGGFDPTLSAGTGRDISVLKKRKAKVLSVLTSLVPQNTCRVLKVNEEDLFSQFQAIEQENFNIKIVKIGLVINREQLNIIKSFLKKWRIHSVFDPIMSSTSDSKLSELEANDVVDFAEATGSLITPNKKEARIIFGKHVTDELRAHRFPAIITGWTKTNGYVGDLIYDRGIKIRRHRILGDSDIHGLGCTFSTLISLYISNGYKLQDAYTQSIKELKKEIKCSTLPGRCQRIFY